jgi:hypothetical protein
MESRSHPPAGPGIVTKQLGLGERFDQLPAGDKAAITAGDDVDADAILTVARAVLASRRGSG